MQLGYNQIFHVGVTYPKGNAGPKKFPVSNSFDRNGHRKMQFGGMVAFKMQIFAKGFF